MTRAARLLLAIPVLLFLACQDQATNPDPGLAGDGPLFKPGGGDPPADPAIAYVVLRDEALMVMNSDGSNKTTILTVEELTDADYCYFRLSSWSPDGSSIAFEVVGPNTTDIWRVDIAVIDGVPQRTAPPVKLVSDGGYPAWSPTVVPGFGQEMIAYSRHHNELVLISTDGSTGATVYTGPIVVDPTWSPDASRIAFMHHSPQDVASQRLVAVNVADAPNATPDTLVPADAFYSFGKPDWSTGGDRIVFTTKQPCPRRGSCNMELYTDVYVYDFAIADTLMLTDVASSFLSWSPDDSLLVGASYGEIHVIDAQNGEIVDVLTNRNGSWPDWRRCEPGPGCGVGN